MHTWLVMESPAPPYIYRIRTWHCAEGSREERGNPHWTENANAALKTNETETQHYYAILNQPVNFFLPWHTPVSPPGFSSLLSPFLSVCYLFFFFLHILCQLIGCHPQYLKSVWKAALFHSVNLTGSVSDVRELKRKGQTWKMLFGLSWSHHWSKGPPSYHYHLGFSQLPPVSGVSPVCLWPVTGLACVLNTLPSVGEDV